jgi:hypothetical protein
MLAWQVPCSADLTWFWSYLINKIRCGIELYRSKHKFVTIELHNRQLHVHKFSYLLKQSATASQVTESEVWSIEKLKAYLSCVRASLHPELTQPAEEVLTKYYQVSLISFDNTIVLEAPSIFLKVTNL